MSGPSTTQVLAMFPLDYNTRVVVLGTGLLGAASGLVGVFLLLRKRALVGDAISHATLPGVAIAYLIALRLGQTSKSLAVLLTGALFSGWLAAACIVILRKRTFLKEDAVLGIVLSVFFGLGTVLLRMIQQLPSGSAAGLEGFIYGKTATMIAEDAMLIGAASLLMVGLALGFKKELYLLCFDSDFGYSQGWPIGFLDMLLMTAVTMVVIVGLQAVGLILMIALLVIPAASARLWTYRLNRLLWISSLLGAISSIAGSLLSSTIHHLPSGQAIVLVAAACFLFSFLLGTERGAVWKWLLRWRQSRHSSRQHFLRAVFEILESRGQPPLQRGLTRSEPLSIQEIQMRRSWSPSECGRMIRRAVRDQLVLRIAPDQIALSAAGIRDAQLAVRQHRLFEFYLKHHAEISASGLDRGADFVEHVLDHDMLAELEQLYMGQATSEEMPDSLHPLADERPSHHPSREVSR